MTTATISDVRRNISEMVNVVQYQHERVILERHGKPVAVLMPFEDYQTLEELEDAHDIAEAEKVLANTKPDEWIPLEEIKRKHGL